MSRRQAAVPAAAPSTVLPWTRAVAAMLAVQISNALSVPVIAQVDPAGTASPRMSFGIVFLWLIARPALHCAA
ncbi:hypothetical protein [Brevibacterium luteolum]|uniref:hypothetical protein n=1 Tax=Brevibacterium luteolum TaxID=199591 RepID=UPI00195DE014|nr:hypothetical protein [Brevibacterium luteolum]MBM7530155.1 threonine/homoserine efflux transporter RhtA [Brevibacterium luteolum]